MTKVNIKNGKINVLRTKKVNGVKTLSIKEFTPSLLAKNILELGVIVGFMVVTTKVSSIKLS